jgi:hypothetical protein
MRASCRLRLGEDLRLLAPVQAQAGGEHAGAGAAVGAERDVVQQAHVRPQLHVLEGARHAAVGDHALRQAGDVLAEEVDAAARHRQRAGEQVEHRRLARARSGRSGRRSRRRARRS